MGLADDPTITAARNDKSKWHELRARFASVFANRTRDEWVEIFSGTDACVTPVLSVDEAMREPHIRRRGVYAKLGDVTQPAPAPRFSRTPSQLLAPPPEPGEHTRDVLLDWGFSTDEVNELVGAGTVMQGIETPA